ncbi:MAG: 50S ribosomal protein L10 [Verrucomicrobia bacterium]|nr:MAG: 50S ribosomal protein L10 [Verrucomicrobiota bacterium]
MRAEKQFLVEEVENHLRKSDYVYLANFERITVGEVSSLRDQLAAQEAEFHVVKNSILRVAAKKLELPDLDEWLVGPTAIVVGGKNPSGVAKVIRSFFKEKDKGEVKVGVVDNRTYTADEVKALSELPSLEELRAQLLGLLTTPMRELLFVFNGVPQGLLNVLQAKVDQENN